MVATISSTFPCTPAELWQQIIQPESLQYVCAPWIGFELPEPAQLNNPPQPGTTYNLRLKLLNFVPLGGHTITIVGMNREKNQIISSEAGALAKTWNHTITFENTGEKSISYTDEVEIEAGLLTFPIWLFAHFFYRHRQRRWRKRLSQI